MSIVTNLKCNWLSQPDYVLRLLTRKNIRMLS